MSVVAVCENVQSDCWSWTYFVTTRYETSLNARPDRVAGRKGKRGRRRSAGSRSEERRALSAHAVLVLFTVTARSTGLDDDVMTAVSVAPLP